MVAFGMLERMEVGIVEVDQGDVLVLAQRGGLTAYEVSYLWLARETSSELVTLDGQLAAASGADL